MQLDIKIWGFPGLEAQEPVAAWSRDIADTEVAIFLPELFTWDCITAQAVINAARRLYLTYRVFLKEDANWENFKTFLTCERVPGEGEAQIYPSVLYVSAHGEWHKKIGNNRYRLTFFGLSDCDVHATTYPDEGGPLPPGYVAKKSKKFIDDPIDPIGGAGLKDPDGTPLCDSPWVKFVWIDACFSNVQQDIWENVNDMAKALGMNCWENHYLFQDQSYIGHAAPTPVEFFNGWLMSVYHWIFWDYLSRYGAGVDPDYGVEQAWLQTHDFITTELVPDGWGGLLYYVCWFNRFSHPSIGAKLKDHIEDHLGE